MVGAYLGLAAFGLCGILALGNSYPLLLMLGILALAMAGTALLGLIIERFAYRPLRHAPRLAPLITAIGVSFVLQNAVMLIFGPVDQRFPELMALRHIKLGQVTVSNLQLCIMVVALALMAVLQRFIQKSRAGKAMRALADDIPTASLMGIPVNKMIALAFVIGSMLAGTGGVLFGMYYNTINFHDGYMVGLKAFTAAVLGGIGNIPGAMVGGVLLGLVEGLGAGYVSSEWKNVFAFVILIVILLFRPQGLWGSRTVKKV